MRINEIIKERRLAKGFTQEQIANYLGVTAPAVNKWEKGTSCPDIVLLPALARLLDTDLNTLLSFQDDLSEKEVALFLNEVSEAAKKDGFEAGCCCEIALCDDKQHLSGRIRKSLYSKRCSLQGRDRSGTVGHARSG